MTRSRRTTCETVSAAGTGADANGLRGGLAISINNNMHIDCRQVVHWQTAAYRLFALETDARARLRSPATRHTQRRGRHAHASIDHVGLDRCCDRIAHTCEICVRERRDLRFPGDLAEDLKIL